jgi:hypothetical protein
LALASLTLAGCDTASTDLEAQKVPDAGPSDGGVALPDGGLVAPDASTPTPIGTANLRSGEVRLADFQGHYDGTQFVIDAVTPAAEPVAGFGLMAREQQLCIMNIIQDGVPGSGPAESVELVTESQARNGACPAPYDTVPSLCANVTLRSFYTDRTRTDVYVRLNSLTTPLANPVLNSAVSTPGLPSGLGIWSYGNLGLAGTPAAAASRDWVFQTTGASFSFTGSVVTNMAEFANGLDDDCDLRFDEGLAVFANGTACVDNTDCTSTLCQGGICAPTTCTNGAPDAGETDLDCGGICGASCVGDKLCTVGTDCISGQCAAGLCLGSTGDVCAGNPSCVNQVCNPNVAVTSEPLAFAPETVSTNAVTVTDVNDDPLGDDTVSRAIPLGFGFNFYGNRYTNIYVSSNGWASFTAPATSNSFPSAIPSTVPPNNLIAMWWADLDPESAGTITYQTVGAAPNRKFILNFANVDNFTYSFSGPPEPSTFQLVLTETANTVDIHCTDCTDGDGDNRTQGIENATGTAGLATTGVNNAIATKTNSSIRFKTVTPSGFCAAAACTDGVDNGNETGVDCGGTCGSNCADGVTCIQNSDCLRGNCTAGLCISCFDGIKNQTEGDTDCGGSCALRCGSSQTCNITADCISGICDASNICVPTGDPGDACATDNDCDSKVCTAGGPGAQGGYPLNLNGRITDGTPVVDADGAPLGDEDLSVPIPIGFDFPFYDTTQTEVVISSNGWLTFGPPGFPTAPTIPLASTPNAIVSFFGRDLDPGDGGTITYATVGTAPNREFLVNFNSVPDFYFSIPDHAPITLQVALQETTGYIDIRCVSCVSGSSTATVGIENTTGTLGIPMTGAAYSAARNLVNTSTRFQTVTNVIGTCLAPTCADITVNQDESGIDCGGATCAARCASGQACIAGADCTSTRCENAVCSTCTDGIKSGTETDFDCGGVCGSTCTDTKACSINSDCASNRCEGGICTSCTDGVLNGTETAIDCGGICGATCNFAETCSIAGDCFTNNCTAGSCGKGATGANCGGGVDCDSQVCAPSIAKGVSDVATPYALVPTAGFTPVTFPSADDSNTLLQIGFSFPFFTGTFTELSLGTNGLFTFGASAPTTTYSAPLGSPNTPNNFVTFFNKDLTVAGATITSGTVGTAPNRKFVIDFQDLADFGGYDHGPVSLQVQLNETTGYIDVMYTNADSGLDTLRIGAEGPSVGGNTPDFVALTGYNPGATAFTNKAVRIGTFNQYPGLCAAPNCTDATKNQGESGIDCGGECGATCAVGTTCGTASDCNPGTTGAAECLLVGTSTICMNCGDGTKNGNEADVDCGGSCATDCVSGQTCGGNADCDSNLCVGATATASGLCAGCADATQNGDETDVDCGGPDCGPCFGGKACTADGDCLSGPCVGGFCTLGATAAACSQGDQCLNGVCGGGTIPASNGVTITYNPHPSINDITAGARASASSSPPLARLDESTYSAPVAIGFPFRFFDTIKTSLSINGGGFVAFDSGIVGGSTGPFVPPTTSPDAASLPNQILAPFWFDGDPSLRGQNNSDVRYLTTGVAPNRRFIVNWIGVAHYALNSDHATFQLVLYENGQYADFFCKDCTLTATGTYGNRAQLVEGTPAPTVANPTPAIVALSAYRNLPAVDPVPTNVYRSDTLNIGNQTGRRYFTNATEGASCVAPTCNDGVKNQGETDIDCGGAACGATCAPTKVCVADTDCGGLGASCTGGVCRNCADGVLNGAETALDCGGQCGATCGGGLACNSGADCATSGCTDGTCNLGLTGELCTAGDQCAEKVCSVPAPVAITAAPDAASLGNLTAGTQATSFGAKLGDSGHSDAVTLPFAFNFFGTNYSSVNINANGWISFDTASTNAHSAPTTSPSASNPNAIIAGYWFDASATVSASADIRYTTVGTAPNRKFIVNYIALPYYSTFSAPITDNVTFQIALNEADNTVDIFFADGTLSYATSRVQVLENGAGTVARSAYSLSTSTTFNIPNNTGYRYSTSSVQACQAPTTTDGVKNGTETDVDCGGTSGTLCAPTKICLANTDCGGANATCNAGFCRNCGDTVKNGNETDVDCGGICGSNCGFNKICGGNADCGSDNCASSRCGLAADGRPCGVGSDCVSGYCDGLKRATTASLSLVGALSDGTNGPTGDDAASAAIPLGFKFRYFGNEYASVKLTTNGHISFGASPSTSNYATQSNSISMWVGDMNAGTGQIKYQTIGTAPFRKFIVNYNSLSHYYPGLAPVQAQAVLHESLNYIDILCVSCGVDAFDSEQYLAVLGASSADLLEVGTLGTLGSTTALPDNSGYRFVTDPLPVAGKICATATCGDAIQNGTETAPDCGGGCGADCTKGAACSAGTDCISGSCSSSLCGGVADGGACSLSNSCDSLICTAGACAAPTCSDVTLNGLETGIDCGGATCRTATPANLCAKNVACGVAADCTSARCEGTTAAPTTLLCRTCDDNIQTGGETDVDCGGLTSDTNAGCISGTAGKCAEGKKCLLDRDCGTGNCDPATLLCAPPKTDCFNGQNDRTNPNPGDAPGLEADVDCGGFCAEAHGARCAAGKLCIANTDCASGICNLASPNTDGYGVCSKGDTGSECVTGADCSSKVCGGIITGDATASGAKPFTAPTSPVPTTITNPANLNNGIWTISGTAFPIRFFGVDYTTVQIQADGVIALGTALTAANYSAAAIPTAAAPNNIVAWFSRNNSNVGAVTPPRYWYTGVAPYRVLVVETGDSPAASDATWITKAQVRFYETSNRIQVSCTGCVSSAAAGGVVQGIENATGTVGKSVAGRGAVVSTGVDYTGNVTFNSNQGSTCQAPTCSDGAKNGSESDVDCGGTCGATCPGAATCGSDADCGTGVCTSGVCELGDAGELCTVLSPAPTAGRTASTQCKDKVCGYAAPIATAPDPTSLGSLTAGTRAGNSGVRLGDGGHSDTIQLNGGIGAPFNFSFFGSVYSSVKVNANGWISFDTASTNSHYPPATVPSDLNPNAVIAGYFADLNPSNASNTTADVRYNLIGTAPNRTFIVNYVAVPYYNVASDTVTFQIALSEADNSVEVFCADCTTVTSTTADLRGHFLENGSGTISRSAYASPVSLTFSIPNNTGWRYPAAALGGPASCQAATNSDFVTNGAETAVDCGGSSGKTCAGGLACLADTDCFSNNCASGFCAKAGTGGACLANADCITNSCTVNSGSTPGTCNQGGAAAGCFATSDCAGAGSTCESGLCRTCSDSALNGTETGVDCGGTCGATCPGASACNTSADCATGVCTSGLCELGDAGELCTVLSPAPAAGRAASTQCKDKVCGFAAPIAITSAPDPTSLGSLTAGTRAGNAGVRLGDTGHSDTIALNGGSGSTFNFAFFGSLYSSVKVNANGWISFNTASTDANFPPATVPSALNPNAVIAGYFADLNPSNASNTTADVRYNLIGTAPNRKFIVNYVAVPYYNAASDTVTLQIALSEADNSVEVFCADCTTTSGATDLRGHFLENGTGTTARSAYATPVSLTFSIPNNTGWRYPATAACQAATNSDFIKNGSETDIDCGGSSGFKCQYNQVCSLAADCASNACTSGLCAKASATGGCLRNADCITNSCTVNAGTTLGTCNTGAAGASCGANSDCANGNCASGVCALSANGAACAADSECSSSWCFSATGAGPNIDPATGKSTNVYSATTTPARPATQVTSATAVPAENNYATFAGGTSNSTKSAAIELPFAYNHFGTSMNYMAIYTAGYIKFGNATFTPPSASTSPTSLFAGAGSTLNPLDAVVPFWRGTLSYTSANFDYWVQGTAPNRQVVIKGTYALTANSSETASTTWSVILYEGQARVDIECTKCDQPSTASTTRAMGVTNSDRSLAYSPVVAEAGKEWYTLDGSLPWKGIMSQTNTRYSFFTAKSAPVCTANSGAAGSPCSLGSSCSSTVCNAGTQGATVSTVSTAPSVTGGLSACNYSAFTTGTSACTGFTDSSNTSPIQIGFPFKMFDKTYSSIRFMSDGFLSFTNTSSTATVPTAYPSTSMKGSIEYFHADMLMNTANTNVFRYGYSGAYPNRVFTAYVNALGHYLTGTTTSAPNSFQIKLYENGNRVEIINANGGSTPVATVNKATPVVHSQAVGNSTGTTAASNPAFLSATGTTGGAGLTRAPMATTGNLPAGDKVVFQTFATAGYCE